jgi:hypothetical protein
MTRVDRPSSETPTVLRQLFANAKDNPDYPPMVGHSLVLIL